MAEPRLRIETQNASDGYPIQVAVWEVPPETPLRGRVLIIHGVQSHQGWYQRLGANLARAGYETYFPDRRGSGANRIDRGHVESARRFIEDVAGQLRPLREASPSVPITLMGISWGGKIALATASRHPGLSDQIALICPGLHARVDVSFTERLKIIVALVVNRRKEFPIPLSDPALFTSSPEGQAFIAGDPLALRTASAMLLAASFFLDRMVRKARFSRLGPILLMLAGQDRIVNNEKTLKLFNSLNAEEKTLIEYPGGHHTLEFDPEPDRYATDLINWMNSRPASTNP